jgi:hypothetical protein
MTQSQIIKEADDRLAKLNPSQKDRPAFKFDRELKRAATEVRKVLDKEASRNVGVPRP